MTGRDQEDTLLERRWERQRRQNRTILWWSLAAAVVIHAVVLWYGPWLRDPPVAVAGTELEGSGAPDWSGSAVRVFFGPPAITGVDGALFQEPADRVLSTERRIVLGRECGQGPSLEGEGASGEVRLLVNETGRIDSVEVTRTTGSICWDRAMGELAGDLRYRWLPNERFDAPVSVYQPVALSLAGY